MNYYVMMFVVFGFTDCATDTWNVLLLILNIDSWTSITTKKHLLDHKQLLFGHSFVNRPVQVYDRFGVFTQHQLQFGC